MRKRKNLSLPRLIGLVYLAWIMIFSLHTILWDVSDYMAFELHWMFGFKMLRLVESLTTTLQIFYDPVFELGVTINTFLDNNWSYFGKFLKYIFWAYQTILFWIPVFLAICFSVIAIPWMFVFGTQYLLKKIT